jgi:uncharacterized lipoprotein YajG
MGRAERIYEARVAARFALVSVLLACLFFGCAEKGPILLTVGYQAPGEKASAASKQTVGVSPFKDGRGKDASVLGRRTIPNGQANDLVVQGTVAELATACLKRALASRGLEVKDVPGWDLTAEGMKAAGAALLFGGEIRTLWLESTASAFKTHLQASVQLSVVAGDVPEKKIVRTIEVSSKLDQDVLYSREKLEEVLSEALSSAIDQIFTDQELLKRFP